LDLSASRVLPGFDLRNHADPRESLLVVPFVQAAQNVVPVAVTAGDKIEGLRRWASGRCLSADGSTVASVADRPP
jgi:hypothetical protein